MVDFCAHDEERIVMNGEEKPVYECKSIIEFKVMVIARLGILRRRVSRADGHVNLEQPSISGGLTRSVSITIP